MAKSEAASSSKLLVRALAAHMSLAAEEHRHLLLRLPMRRGIVAAAEGGGEIGGGRGRRSMLLAIKLVSWPLRSVRVHCQYQLVVEGSLLVRLRMHPSILPRLVIWTSVSTRCITWTAVEDPLVSWRPVRPGAEVTTAISRIVLVEETILRRTVVSLIFLVQALLRRLPYARTRRLHRHTKSCTLLEYRR